MYGALAAGVPGIVGECGGTATCGTCHIRIPHGSAASLPPPDDFELETLEQTGTATADSRLSCQVRMIAELDGLTVQVAVG